MRDWMMTTLASVRRAASAAGMTDLADEMDVAILVAANEFAERGFLGGNEPHVEGAGRDRGEVVSHPRLVGAWGRH